MKRILLLTVVALAVGVLAPTAHAGLVMQLQSSATTLTIGDNDGVYDFVLDGVVSYNGVLGTTTWSVNITTGLSKPVFPAIPPKMDLNSVNVSTTGPGTLTLFLTDTDFSLPVAWNGKGVLNSHIGGTTNGTITLIQTVDPDNSEFAVTTPGNDIWVQSGPFSTPSFSDDQAAAVQIAGSFSITEKVTIVHTSSGATSFDAESVVVPVPAAVLLGLLGLGAAGVKLRRFA